MQLTGRRYDTGEPTVVRVQNGCVVEVLPLPIELAGAHLPWLAPGLVDIQLNGWAGVDFCTDDIDVAGVLKVGEHQAALGVTSYLPTITTSSFERMSHGLKVIAQACEQSPIAARQIAGIHVEGPYICTEDGPRGAHPLAHCRKPDWDEFQRFQEAAGGRIKLVTLSPEYAEAPAFIRRAVDAGVLISIGHTGANREQILAAVDAGARLSTHLGNGCHRVLPRHVNYIYDQLAEDRLTASLIADGHHLPPPVVKSFVRGKTPARCVLVSDATGMAGMPPGRYDTALGGVEVLENGKLVVAGQRELLAGASLPLSLGIPNVMRMAGVSLAEAIDMATFIPARLTSTRCGGFKIGSPADFIQFDLPQLEPGDLVSPLSIRATSLGGEVVFGEVKTIG